MQKHHFIFLFSFLLIFSVSEAALAAIISLPRYQGSIAHKYTDRTQSGGKDKVEVSCSSRGGYAKGSHQTCTGLFMVNGQTCYKSCMCSDGYKANASGTCVAKTCSDYGLKSSPEETKSCPQVSKAPNLTCYECVACDTSVYKYACSGGLNASIQQGSTCNKLYSGCGCVANASWNSTSGKCVCGDDYKASASGSSCIAKTCEDYGYLTDEVEGQSCLEMIPNDGYHPIGQNARCFLCSACDSSYKYDCSSITNNNGGDGTACGGKYAKCKCKDLYSWDSTTGTCGKDCTKNSCSTTTYPLTAQNVANAISYEECTPNCSDEPKRYKVSSCATNYNVNSAGSACELDAACSVTPVTIPENASCSNINSCDKCTAWDCNSGYNKSGNTCVEACVPNSCSAADYPLLIEDYNNDENAIDYDECTPSCADEPKRYKITQCSSGYDVDESGSVCVEGCDEWEDNGSILYTDGSICSNIVKDKVPYAVILDTDRFIAVSLYTSSAQVWGLEHPDAEVCDGNGDFIGDASSKSHSANLARDLEEVFSDDDGLSHTQFAVMNGGFTGVFYGAISETRTHHSLIFGKAWYGYDGSGVTTDANQYGHWWFVPSYTEMSILSANIKSANQVLTDIKNAYGKYAVPLEYGWYWISIQTWGADGYAVRLSPDAGVTSTPAYEYKTACTKLPVRYFIRYDKFRDLAERYKREQQP